MASRVTLPPPRLEVVWVNRDYSGVEWFLALLKSAEQCPMINIMVEPPGPRPMTPTPPSCTSPKVPVRTRRRASPSPWPYRSHNTRYSSLVPYDFTSSSFCPLFVPPPLSCFTLPIPPGAAPTDLP